VKLGQHGYNFLKQEQAEPPQGEADLEQDQATLDALLP
jgi:hypothetical protein